MRIYIINLKMVLICLWLRTTDKETNHIIKVMLRITIAKIIVIFQD